MAEKLCMFSCDANDLQKSNTLAKAANDLKKLKTFANHANEIQEIEKFANFPKALLALRF